MSLWKEMFTDKLLIDNRSPITTFSYNDREYGVYTLQLQFWIQTFASVGVMALSLSIAWIVIYHFIVVPNNKKNNRRGGYLMGFGFVIPILIMSPFWVLNFLNAQNLVVRFSVCAIYPLITFFRCLEAMFGYTPKESSDTLANYLIYNISVLDIQYQDNTTKDKNKKLQPKKASTKDNLLLLKSFLSHVTLLGLFVTVLKPMNNYRPFPTNVDGNIQLSHHNIISDLFNMNSFLNNIVGAIYFQITLTTFIIALNLFVSLVLGIQLKGAMNNPMFQTTSASDFWGKRWNLIVHGALKRGVFKPLYSLSSSKIVAVFGAFGISGLFHEYLLYIVFYNSTETKVAYGNNTAFMLWNAGIILLEFILTHSKSPTKPLLTWMKVNLPQFVNTFLIVSTALPVAHWFVHPYLNNGFFEHLTMACPIIREI